MKIGDPLKFACQITDGLDKTLLFGLNQHTQETDERHTLTLRHAAAVKLINQQGMGVTFLGENNGFSFTQINLGQQPFHIGEIGDRLTMKKWRQ